MTSVFRTPGSLITGYQCIKELTSVLSRMNCSQVLIVTDSTMIQVGIIAKIEPLLREASVSFDIFSDIVPEPSLSQLGGWAKTLIHKNYDTLIGIGGGSVLDSTKLLSIMLTVNIDTHAVLGIDKLHTRKTKLILLPTTAGTGSEMTSIAIFTDDADSIKKGIVSPQLLADVSIIDSDLTSTVPPAVTAATGLDALVHAVESYISTRSNVLTETISLRAVNLISNSLRKAVYQGENKEARETMALGSMLAGISLENAGVGAVHALAYPLGGKYKVPHGTANSLLLPYVMKYNITAEPRKCGEIAKAMGEPTDGLSDRDAAELAVKALNQLARDICIPEKLREVGVDKKAIPQLAKEAVMIDRLMRNNPRSFSVDEIETIYFEAY